MPSVDQPAGLVGGPLKICLMVIFVFVCLNRPIDACPLQLPTASVSIAGHRLLVELADTDASRSCGLSHRWVLEKDCGMLFVYPHASPRTFWMKNTRIPLSIAFLDDTGRILNIELMTPGQTDIRYHSHGPAGYALEVNQGWFAAHGIRPGHRVEFFMDFGNGK